MIIGSHIPRVDVFITCCCGEDLIILNDIIGAACVLGYPIEKFRKFVLDDGGCSQVQNAVSFARAEYPNLYYASRKKPKIPDYKAGILNYGLCYSQAIGDPADLVAGIDADVIVDLSWLRATIPHLLKDPNVGLIGPPQVIGCRRYLFTCGLRSFSSMTTYQRMTS